MITGNVTFATLLKDPRSMHYFHKTIIWFGREEGGGRGEREGRGRGGEGGEGVEMWAHVRFIIEVVGVRTTSHAPLGRVRYAAGAAFPNCQLGRLL